MPYATSWRLVVAFWGDPWPTPTIGARLKAKRRQLGMSLREAAERFGWDPETIRGYERTSACPQASVSLLKFPDNGPDRGAVFWSSKMAIDVDGPAADTSALSACRPSRAPQRAPSIGEQAGPNWSASSSTYRGPDGTVPDSPRTRLAES